MNTIEQHEFTVPSHWLAYIFNADDSGISCSDAEECDRYLSGYYAVDSGDTYVGLWQGTICEVTDIICFKHEG